MIFSGIFLLFRKVALHLPNAFGPNRFGPVWVNSFKSGYINSLLRLDIQT